MKNILRLVAPLVLIISFSVPALADVAPPAPPPGSSLLPGQEMTQVRMLAETVLIEVLERSSSGGNAIARVSADFTMRNLGAESESMAVRFPISANDGFYNYPEIKDLQVQVGGNRLSTRRITIPDPDDDDYQLPWAEFDATFPAGQEVLIRVTYTLEGVSEYPYVNFEYILESGAGWQGTIGSVDLIVRLPYEANSYNVLLDSSWGMGQTSPGAVVSGREVRWHYDDLEPTREHNLSVALLQPAAWNAVLTEQSNVGRNPQDGEAWGRLGKAYKTVSRLRRGLRDDPGGLELFELGIGAYEKAVTILPRDALWHAGFAELLFDGYYWQEYSSPEKPGMLRALQELARAYELKPNDAFIRELIDDMRFALPGALILEGETPVFLWLTATPTVPPSPTPTITVTPTSEPTSIPPSLTPAPSSTAIPTPSPSPLPPADTAVPEQSTPQPATKPGVQVCGVSLFIPLGILLKRRHKVHPKEPSPLK